MVLGADAESKSAEKHAPRVIENQIEPGEVIPSFLAQGAPSIASVWAGARSRVGSRFPTSIRAEDIFEGCAKRVRRILYSILSSYFHQDIKGFYATFLKPPFLHPDRISPSSLLHTTWLARKKATLEFGLFEKIYTSSLKGGLRREIEQKRKIG